MGNVLGELKNLKSQCIKIIHIPKYYNNRLIIMAEIRDLVEKFTVNHSIQFFKNMSDLMGNLNKMTNVKDLTDYSVVKRQLTIDKLNFYFNAKQFRKNGLGEDSTDEGRLKTLINNIADGLSAMTEFDSFYFNKDVFFEQFKNYMTSEDVISVLEPFITKSAKTLGPKLRKILFPSDSDTTQELINLRKCVKYYDDSFTAALNKLREYKIYTSTEFPLDRLTELANTIVDSGSNLLSLACGETNTSVWVINNCEFEIAKEDTSDNYEFLHVDSDHLCKLFTNGLFTLSPFHKAYLTKKPLDSMKSLYFNNNLVEFKKCVNAIQQTRELNCYKGIYKESSEFNQYNETSLGNAISGFAKNYEPMTNMIIAQINFSGKVGDVNVETYWFTVGDIQELMSTKEMYNGMFYDLFDWTTITPDEFIQHTKNTDEKPIYQEFIH